MLQRLLNLLYPPRCILCHGFLNKQETDLCHNCRAEAPEFSASKIRIPFVARWTALWYYKGNVRESLLRFKFHNRRSYAMAYGRLLAMKISREMPQFDMLTWVPIGKRRLWKRGYDQVALIARSVASELQIKPVRTLVKIRNAPTQSGIHGVAERRANILNAFRVRNAAVAGKRILLLDDIVTTGATASECARTLLLAGAQEVYVAAVATAPHDRKKENNQNL